MIDKQRLEEKCSTWNIALTGTQLDQLDAFAQILVDYNQKVNLTAITDPEGIEDKHFLDSLLFASQPEVAGRMVDVGAGAGFPGIVTKIYKPELELTLMEPTGKRVEFNESENSTSQLAAGIVRFHIYMTPPSPMQKMDFVLEYDLSYLAALVAA